MTGNDDFEPVDPAVLQSYSEEADRLAAPHPARQVQQAMRVPDTAGLRPNVFDDELAFGEDDLTVSSMVSLLEEDEDGRPRKRRWPGKWAVVDK